MKKELPFKKISDASKTHCAGCGDKIRTIGWSDGEGDDTTDGGPDIGAKGIDGKPYCIECIIAQAKKLDKKDSSRLRLPTSPRKRL